MSIPIQAEFEDKVYYSFSSVIPTRMVVWFEMDWGVSMGPENPVMFEFRGNSLDARILYGSSSKCEIYSSYMKVARLEMFTLPHKHYNFMSYFFLWFHF